MKYFEVRFQLSPWNDDASDILAALCGELNYESFVSEEPFLSCYIQQGLFNQSQLEEMLLNFPVDETCLTYNVYEVEDKDWNEEWEKNGFEPIVIGEELTVQGAEHGAISSNAIKAINSSAVVMQLSSLLSLVQADLQLPE